MWDGNSEAAYTLQALDGLGSSWAIFVHYDTNLFVNESVSRCGFSRDGNASTAVLLFKWDKGHNVTSLLPPKDGWEDAGANEHFRDEVNWNQTNDDNTDNKAPLVSIQWNITSGRSY